MHLPRTFPLLQRFAYTVAIPDFLRENREGAPQTGAKSGATRCETRFAARVTGELWREAGSGKKKTLNARLGARPESTNGVEQPVLVAGRAGYLMLEQVSGAAASIRRFPLAGSYGMS